MATSTDTSISKDLSNDLNPDKNVFLVTSFLMFWVIERKSPPPSRFSI